MTLSNMAEIVCEDEQTRSKKDQEMNMYKKRRCFILLHHCATLNTLPRLVKVSML